MLLKYRYFFSVVFLSILFFPESRGQEKSAPDIIPAPVSMEIHEGVFEYGAGTVIRYGCNVGKSIGEYLSKKTSAEISHWLIKGMPEKNAVMLVLDPSADLPAEGYTLGINPAEILITGKDRAGLFYGVQTLLQMLPVKNPGHVESVCEIPCLHIEDYPRFGYRGFMLDVARTFTGTADIMLLLERMSMYKLNRFHWHLTDDEGWRLYLENHPRLALEGGFRGGGDTPVRNIYGSWGKRYGGYFTPPEVKKVVAFAKSLNIEIVPEFDLPGHSRAIARVYPDILCRGPVNTDVSAGYDLRNVWCAGKESNFEIINEIIDEICRLFPGALIHTGGDEVAPEQWEACPDCQQLMKREGLKDTKALNTWFENRVGEMVAGHGRRQAVWNEAIDDSRVEGDPVIWAWENEKSVSEALSAGYATVAMTSQAYYFDMKQSAEEIGLAWGGIIGLKKAYEYEPEPTGKYTGQLLGVEAGLWTETFLWNGEWWRDYQIFPRLLAMAETAWSPEEVRDFNNFEGRINRTHLARLAELGIGYRGRDGIKKAPVVSASRMKVAYEVSGSVPCTAKNPYSNASDNDTKTFARTIRTPRAGDWFLYKFGSPVKCSSITVRSGYNALPRLVIGPAVLEVSYNGVDYEMVQEDFGFTGTFSPRAAVHSIRLTVTGEGNGEDAAIIQDLVIMK